MAGERRAIEHPLWIDFSTMPVPPFKFVLQDGYTPAGVVETVSEGVTAVHTPWYVEVVLTLTGTDTVAVLYGLPRDDDTSLLMACLERTVEPLFELMSGDDFGDGITKLVAQHWPDLYAMLAASGNPHSGARILCNVATPNELQWMVADQFTGSARDNVSAEQSMDLITTSLRTMLRVINFAVDLPGVLAVLGGPDQMSRRLKALSGLLTTSADVGRLFQGGIKLDELVDLAKGAHEIYENARDLKE